MPKERSALSNLDQVKGKWQQYTSLLPEWLESFSRHKTYGEDVTEDVQTINGILGAMVSVVKIYFAEAEFEIGKEVGDKALEYIEESIKTLTGGDFEILEDYSQKNKVTNDPYLNWHYEVLLAEAPYYLDAYCLYIERDRLRRERFYEPRREVLKQVVDEFQRLEEDKLDRLFIHMPARVGKTQITTFYASWHCARDTESSNLYVTYKEGLGGAFLDGVSEIYTDPTYRFADVFPRVKITATDAKNNKLDLGTDARRKKKYKSLSGKGLESGLNGEYDASGVLIFDDILEGIQDVLSNDVLERKRTIFQNNAKQRAKESCKIVYMGTIWATNDIYMKEAEFLETDPTSKDLKVEVIKIPALDVNDESNFDYKYGVGFSSDHYKRVRATFEMNNDMAGWWCQCQQEPIDRQGTIFDPSKMKYYKVLPEGEPLKIISHCDVALGGGDFLSFPIVYYYEDEEGDLEGYVQDVVFDNSEKHITQPQVIEKIKKHGIKNVHFEANQGGEGYKDEIIDRLKTEKIRINVTSDWAPANKRKDQRIWDCAQDIRELHFLEPSLQEKQYRMFMTNLFGFVMNKTSKRFHDDAADSLAGLVEFAKEGSGVSTAVIMRSLI